MPTSLSSFACISIVSLKGPHLSCRFLEEALGGGSGLRRRDLPLAFKAVARSEVGSFVAWQFLSENWRELRQL